MLTKFGFLLFVVVTVQGQSYFTKICVNPKEIKPFNWTELSSVTWNDLYKSDHDFEMFNCATAEFVEDGKRYLVMYKGTGDQYEEFSLVADNTTSTYTVNDRKQTIVAYKKDAYAVIHECQTILNKTFPAKTYTYVLGADKSLKFEDMVEIEKVIKRYQINVDDMHLTTQWGSTCNNSPLSRVLIPLLAFCTTLTMFLKIKFF